jgi:CheY-like chemotaxis protein
MHKGDSHRSGSERVLTQAQADSCCASSESKNSNQFSPTFVAVITAAVLDNGIVLPTNIPALVLSDEWRTMCVCSDSKSGRVGLRVYARGCQEGHVHMSLRILVVEDFQPFRRLICTALQRRAEFQTIEAADGLEAIQKAEALQPDLILLDINLPKLHGFEVAKQIRSLAPHARLLFMSQESSADIVRKALSLGADGYVRKLSAGTDLLPAIDAVLGGQRFVSSSLAFTERVSSPTAASAQ